MTTRPSKRQTSRSRTRACCSAISFSCRSRKLPQRFAIPPGPRPRRNCSPGLPTAASSDELCRRPSHNLNRGHGKKESGRPAEQKRSKDACSARPSQQQPMQRHHLRRQRVQLNLRQAVVVDLSPPVHARLRFRLLSTLEPFEKLPRIVHCRFLVTRRPRNRLHGIAPQQLVPVVCKQLPGSENVAPCHLPAVGNYHSNHPLALQSRGFFAEAPL